MSRVVSFPQLFAIAKGANYRTLIPFQGVPFTTLLNPSYLPPKKLGQPNAIPGVQTDNNANYVFASPTSTFNGSLVFKSGGNLSDRDFLLLYPQETVKYVVFGTPARCMGDWLMLFRASGADAGPTSSIYPVEGGIMMENFENIYSRCVLTDALNGTNHSLSAPSAGYLNNIGRSEMDFSWTGKIMPWLGSNNSGTYRVIVGLHRTHRNSTDPILTIPSNPLGGPVNVPLNGSILGFVPFGDSDGNYRWCFVSFNVDEISNEPALVYSAPTSVSAFSEATIEISVQNGLVNAYINGTQFVSNYDYYVQNPFSEFVQWGVEVREIVSSSANPNVTNSRHRLFTRQMTLAPGNYSFTELTKDNTESSYHDTGLQLLKKLK